MCMMDGCAAMKKTAELESRSNSALTFMQKEPAFHLRVSAAGLRRRRLPACWPRWPAHMGAGQHIEFVFIPLGFRSLASLHRTGGSATHVQHACFQLLWSCMIYGHDLWLICRRA